MLKISFIGLLFLGLLGFDDGVIVVDTTPSHMTPGENVVVDITITKAQIQSFGKLLINLPEGFTAEEVESSGATFTFANNKAKFIWMTLPQQEVFTVKYMLVSDNNLVDGNYDITGAFSYIKNNQRIDYQLTDKIVKVADTKETAIDIYDNSPVDDPNATETTENPDPSNTSASTATEITCTRTYERVSQDQFKITLKVERAGYIGFAKIVDEFSAEYDVAEGDSDGATTMTSAGKVKYVWFEVPEVDEFYVSYYVTSEEFANSMPDINGKLTVIENGDPKDTPIKDIKDEEVFAQDKNATVTPDPIITPDPDPVVIVPDPIVTPDPVITPDPIVTPDPDPIVTPDPDPVATVDPDPVITSVPDPETGVSYKVQILAAHKTIGRTYFKRQHKYAESFNIENHEGWIKYTTGSHSDYKQARDERVRINSRYVLPGPFVTAYNEGERITVQEALMITKQQWYQ